jgi:hypothetical protein
MKIKGKNIFFMQVIVIISCLILTPFSNYSFNEINKKDTETISFQNKKNNNLLSSKICMNDRSGNLNEIIGCICPSNNECDLSAYFDRYYLIGYDPSVSDSSICGKNHDILFDEKSDDTFVTYVKDTPYDLKNVWFNFVTNFRLNSRPSNNLLIFKNSKLEKLIDTEKKFILSNNLYIPYFHRQKLQQEDKVLNC